jgi:IS5 family transposase
MRGPCSTPITPLTGSFFHADPHTWLKGANGDAINVVLVAAGHNIRLLLAWLKLLCALIRAAILAASQRTPITINRKAFT